MQPDPPMIDYICCFATWYRIFIGMERVVFHNTDDVLDTDSFRPRAVNEGCCISWENIFYRSDRVRVESGEPVCGLTPSSVYHPFSSL